MFSRSTLASISAWPSIRSVNLMESPVLSSVEHTIPSQVRDKLEIPRRKSHHLVGWVFPVFNMFEFNFGVSSKTRQAKTVSVKKCVFIILHVIWRGNLFLLIEKISILSHTISIKNFIKTASLSMRRMLGGEWIDEIPVQLSTLLRIFLYNFCSSSSQSTGIQNEEDRNRFQRFEEEADPAFFSPAEVVSS